MFLKELKCAPFQLIVCVHYTDVHFILILANFSLLLVSKTAGPSSLVCEAVSKALLKCV